MTAAARIVEVEPFLLDVPTIRPHALAMTTMRRQTLVLVRVRCADGVVGWGEGTTIGGLSYGEESPEGIALAIDTYLAPVALAAETSRLGAVMSAVDRHVKGNHHAKSAIETALLDVWGKRLGVPVSELLGGRVRERLEVAWTLASGDTGRDVAEAEEMLARRRHRIFKLKIGSHEPRDDVAHVAAIKRALGDRASVRVDVNQAWDEPTAGWGIAALEAAGVDLVEQPVPRAHRGAMSRLAARFTVPIMADETLRGPEDAYDVASSNAADVFAVKVSPSGGPRAAARVAAIADAAGRGLYGGTMLEGSVGTAAAAQVCATFPRLVWGTELFGPLLLTEEIVRAPLAYADFGLEVPDRPGLGIDVDEERVAALRRDPVRPRGGR